MSQHATIANRSRLVARISGAWSRALGRRPRGDTPGTKVGQYTLDTKIGEGAMGIVYRGQHTMLRRTGVPRDIGYAVLYLSSDEGAFVTGAVLPVDGGWTAM